MSNKNIIKTYFFEIMREFFDYWTSIYYRVNLSNPRTLLHELLSYCKLAKWTSHLQFDHIKCLIDEYLYLWYKDIAYKYYYGILWNFHDFLKDISNRKKIELQELNEISDDIISRVIPILKEVDKHYYQDCKKDLKNILNSETKDTDFTKIKKICFSLSTEILRRWYSKGYIYEKIMEELHDKLDVDNFLNHFDKNEYQYNVYIKFCKLPKDINEKKEIISIFENVLDNQNVSLQCFEDISNLKEDDVKMNKDKSKSLLQEFKMNKNSFFIHIKQKAIDYSQAIQKSKEIIDKLLNEIYYEYSSSKISYFHHAICIEEVNHEIKIPVISPPLDSYQERGSLKFFNSFNKSLSWIEEKNWKISDTYSKLNTLLKFYRYFMKADTLEHKFLNLWIGWEHMFSLSSNKDQYTWKNIYTFFPDIYALHYTENILKNLLNVQFKRNCTDDKKEELESFLNKILSDNPRYKLSNLCAIIKLKNMHWDELLNMDIIKNDDLTKVKLFRLHEKLKDPKKFVKWIREKTKWNLFRIYRIRNFIVHRWWSYELGIPLEIIVSQLESFYRDLIWIVVSRFTASERFDDIEQIFLAYERTFKDMISDNTSLSHLKDPQEFKRQLLNKHLIY